MRAAWLSHFHLCRLVQMTTCWLWKAAGFDPEYIFLSSKWFLLTEIQQIQLYSCVAFITNKISSFMFCFLYQIICSVSGHAGKTTQEENLNILLRDSPAPFRGPQGLPAPERIYITIPPTSPSLPRGIFPVKCHQKTWRSSTSHLWESSFQLLVSWISSFQSHLMINQKKRDLNFSSTPGLCGVSPSLCTTNYIYHAHPSTLDWFDWKLLKQF